MRWPWEEEAGGLGQPKQAHWGLRDKLCDFSGIGEGGLGYSQVFLGVGDPRALGDITDVRGL